MKSLPWARIRRKFFGADIGQARPRGPTEAALLSEALCEARQDRCGRCEGDL